MENINVLRAQLRQAEQNAREKERKERMEKEEKFRKETNINVYSASDYAGLVVGRYKFYFGYEEQYCKTHKKISCGCDDTEDCFTAEVDDKEVMRMPRSEVCVKDEGVETFLLYGIGHFLKKL